MNSNLRNYFTITGNYWVFTVTDGAIRMLVVLYFHELGYSPLQIASLFLFYEFFGIVTNLVGGWLGSRIGLNRTMQIGTGLQIVALAMLAVPEIWLSVPYVMLAQALSGIAKDLNKMSAKASVKLMLPEQAQSRLFKWVAVLTGSKNTLKGFGFFLGGLLLGLYGFSQALIILASFLTVAFLSTLFLLKGSLGNSKSKAKFSQVFSKTPQVNWLSAARFFLFGARDIWFVIAVPVFLSSTLGWSHTEIGSFFALWIIGYGIVQALTPRLLNKKQPPNAKSISLWGFLLASIPITIILGFKHLPSIEHILIGGLIAFGVVFAINSAMHSYLIVAWSDRDKVSMNVGFYYMANAGGRLTGTVLSGVLFQFWGLEACLWGATIFLITSGLMSLKLSNTKNT